MEWITPKTNWAAREDANGNYVGDYFNAEDYNRIKNNIEYLGAMARKFWPVMVRAMPDRRYEEYPYADEINTLADNLEAINAFVGSEIGPKTIYSANGAFIGFEDLNRLESACMKLYEAMYTLYRKGSKLPFRFGAGYYALKNPKMPSKRTRLPFNVGIRFGQAYYPHKVPGILRVDPDQEVARLPLRLGSDYFPS